MQKSVVRVKYIGGSDIFFFTKNNIGSYIKNNIRSFAHISKNTLNFFKRVKSDWVVLTYF